MSPPAVAALDERDDGGRAAVPIDLDDLAGLLGAVLAAEGVPDRAEAALNVVDAGAIAALKAEHLGGDGPTDVLSFPVDGAGPVPDDEHWLVGDVVLCPEVAAAQAPDHAGAVADELALLVVHGALHLCGWDHATPADRARMWGRERDLLVGLGRPPARDPWSPAGPEEER